MGNLIAKLYRVRLTRQGVGTYLRRWGLTSHCPDKRAVEQNAEAVRVRHQETWPAIRAKAGAEGSEVLFADQVGIRSDQVTGRTWGDDRNLEDRHYASSARTGRRVGLGGADPGSPGGADGQGGG